MMTDAYCKIVLIDDAEELQKNVGAWRSKQQRLVWFSHQQMSKVWGGSLLVHTITNLLGLGQIL